jgi:flagellar protein FliL
MALSRVILTVLILNTLVLLGSAAANFYLLSSALPGLSHLPFAAAPAGARMMPEYQFFPIEKVIVNLRDRDREHYFVLDLVLQSDLGVDRRRIEQIDPIVRNAVIAYLSGLSYQDLRTLPISEVQSRLEKVLLADLQTRNLGDLFSHLLVSKMIVQ